MIRIPARGRQVTDEPLSVDPGLLGAPLASFRRRAVAYLLDLVLFGLVAGALFLGLSLWSIHRDDATFLPRFAEAASGVAADDSTADTDLTLDLFALIKDRAPAATPPARPRPCWASWR